MIKANRSIVINLALGVFIVLIMSSCISRQKPVPLKGELPSIPKYSGTTLKLQKGEVSPAILVIPANDSKSQIALVKTLKKELSLLNPKQEKEIAQLKAKIAFCELVVADFDIAQNTSEQLKKKMKLAGYQISTGYRAPRNKTALYLENLKSKNSAFRDAVVNPEDYSLSNVLNDISDAAVEYDYNFNSDMRTNIDRVVVVKLAEKKEIYDTDNYGADVKFQIEIYDSKTSRRIGDVEVWGRSLQEVSPPFTDVKLNNERKRLKSRYDEATEKIPANLMKMKEFKKLLLEPATDTTTKK